MDTGRRSNAKKKTIFESSDLVNKNTSKLGQKWVWAGKHFYRWEGSELQWEGPKSPWLQPWVRRASASQNVILRTGTFPGIARELAGMKVLRFFSQICPTKERLENYALSLGELKRIQQLTRQYGHPWYTGLTFVFLEVRNNGGKDVQTKLTCSYIKSSINKYLYFWKVTGVFCVSTT